MAKVRLFEHLGNESIKLEPLEAIDEHPNDPIAGRRCRSRDSAG